MSDTPETDALKAIREEQRHHAQTLNERDEYRKLADDALATLRETREKYGIGDRHVMGEKNRELREAWHLLSVLSANMLDDGPTWPRVLEWLRRNEQYRPVNEKTPPRDGEG
jgi:hypothetical protein